MGQAWKAADDEEKAKFRTMHEVPHALFCRVEAMTTPEPRHLTGFLGHTTSVLTRLRLLVQILLTTWICKNPGILANFPQVIRSARD